MHTNRITTTVRLGWTKAFQVYKYKISSIEKNWQKGPQNSNFGHTTPYWNFNMIDAKEIEIQLLFFSIFVNVHFFSGNSAHIKKCHPLFLQHCHHHKTTTTILYHSVANVPRLWVPYYTFLGILLINRCFRNIFAINCGNFTGHRNDALSRERVRKVCVF